MIHPDDRQLILYLLGGPEDRDAWAQHVERCPACASELEKLQRVVAAASVREVPEPDEGFEARIWARQREALHARGVIGPEASRRRSVSAVPSAARNGMRPRSGFGGLRVVGWGALAAAALLVAFLIGLYPRSPAATPDASAAGAGGRDRILMASLGGHLERSRMILLEVANAERPDDLLAWREPAQRLISANRLYRQSARLAGEPAVADLLGEIERLLLDLAQSPDGAGAEDLQWLRSRVQERDLVFKVHVLAGSARQWGTPARPVSRGL